MIAVLEDKQNVNKTLHNYIEINGQRYDAASGDRLDQTSRRQVVTRNLEGFFHKVKPPRRAASHAGRHKTQKSATLMRHGVKKPGASAISSRAAPLSDLTPEVKTESGLRTAPAQRLHRAHKIPQSNLISRFGFSLRPGTMKKFAPLAVKAAPDGVHHSAGQVSPRHDPFAKALAEANAHQQKPLKKRRLHHRVARRLGTSSKIVAGLAGAATVLLLGGFIAYQNMPNVAMRIAAARAGFNASMPSYQPNGFALKGPIQHSPGKIIVNFRSNSDERSFTVVQSPTNWNSETLLDNFVAAKQLPYQTYQEKGKTIYIYNGTNATWINRGVLYQIESNSSLNSDQLLRLADSF